jgi:ankyrin repeat protein
MEQTFNKEARMSTTQHELTQQMKDEFVGVAHGDYARVKEMLEEHPDLVSAVASWGETAIQAAAQMANRYIAELLLSAGAPLDICTAAALGMSDRVEAMLEEDPSQVNATGAHGIPLMHFPVVGGHKEIAEMLIARGADVNTGDGLNTALHGATHMNSVDMTNWLISHHANINAHDYEGKTPLSIATANGYAELAELLRQHGGVE